VLYFHSLPTRPGEGGKQAKNERALTATEERAEDLAKISLASKRGKAAEQQQAQQQTKQQNMGW